jgi:hypothetical protein
MHHVVSKQVRIGKDDRRVEANVSPDLRQDEQRRVRAALLKRDVVRAGIRHTCRTRCATQRLQQMRDLLCGQRKR